DQRAGRDCGCRRDHSGRGTQNDFGDHPGNDCHRVRYQQYRRRLHDHRSNVENVQGRWSQEGMSQMASSDIVIEIAYVIATALFILSLKWLSSPTTARRGVFSGEAGMLLAIAGTLLNRGIVDYKWITIALVLGTVIGIPLGRVQMTAVPQRTALSHAFGALCVTLVGTAEFYF